MYQTAFVAVAALALAGFLLAWLKMRQVAAAAGGERPHSLPGYHGVFVAAWAGIPSILLVFLWIAIQGPVLDQLIMGSLPADYVAGKEQGQLNLILSEIKSVAGGAVFGTPTDVVRAAAERYQTWGSYADYAMVAAALAVALAGLSLARLRISAEFRARTGVERILDGIMLVCAVVAILTTLGIVLSLVFEAWRFFVRVPVGEFLFGLNWEPQIAIRADQVAGAGAFGAIPVFTGTILVAFIAMLVATPIGLLSAVYLSEYADPRVRNIVKPVLEILSGIPTVVYGFFAVLTVAPALREFGVLIGLDVAPNSALAAGAVMGIMILPFISSLSDDALTAVPRNMREGAYALGATQSETIKQVLLPAALPGIVGGILLAVSRAIGETMIVVMAAGLIAKLTMNPLDSVTTVTVQIVSLLIGDTEFDNAKTLAAFALGLALFLTTLVLNVAALRIVRKYREKYE